MSLPHASTLSPAARASARFWDRMARRYAAAKIADPGGYENTLRRVAALLDPAHAVLELGCGTGSTALRLATGVHRWQGTDVSAAMVAIARDKLAAAPQPGLRFEQADVLDAQVPLLRVVGLAPPLRRFDGTALRAAIEAAGLRVESVERHGSGRKDVRVFIVARRPG